MIRAILPVLLLWPLTAGAVTFEFPINATMQIEKVATNDSYDMPVGPWADGVIPVREVAGAVTRQAWRIATPGLSTQQIMQELRLQLEVAGFEVLFSCRTDFCGGFDFRFGTEVLPPPEMQVDLGDFRFLAAQRQDGDDTETVSLLVSRSSRAGFVQMIRVGVATAADVLVTPTDQELAGPVAAPVVSGDFAASLDEMGHAVLADLTFDIASSDLAAGDFASLRQLADYLLDRPDRRVALVGHTDSSGSLDANIALSKRRARSVLNRLVDTYGVARAQLAAEGMGYLSPIASNLTPEGRDANRRVEVIVTSTE